MLKFTWMDTPVGRLKLVCSDEGLTAALFDQEYAARVGLAEMRTSDGNLLLQHAKRELEEYFAGTRQRFTVRVSPRGTPFQQACWEQLQKIPYGSTATYGQRSARIGAPGKARAVGAANGRNPIAIIIP